MKLAIRLVAVFIILGSLLLLANLILGIPVTVPFLHFILLSYGYILFWFAVCFFVILLRKSSNTNAIILLTTWLILVVFLPVVVNNYITKKYPVEEAFSMTIKQRDEYHKRWDTDKKETLTKFYKHYPQLAKYRVKEKGFSWLWYYAMQQMGDDGSKQEREAMYTKIRSRETLSAKIAQFFPPLQVQLSMNAIANTSLTHQIQFLEATTKFHEDLRLQLYPKIFEHQHADTINWNHYKPKFFEFQYNFQLLKNAFFMTAITLILIGVGAAKNLKYFN